MRYRLLDTLRGIFLVSMLFYHTCWDLVHLYGRNWPWFGETAGYVWQQSICWGFILLSGFCAGLKNKNRGGLFLYKRGLIVLAAGTLITVVTVTVTPETPVIFGVLFFLGIAMLLTAVLNPLFRKISAPAGLSGSALLFFLLRNINEEILGFENLKFCPLPSSWYGQGWLATFLGFQDKDFFSTDYFSLLPWYFLFLAGWFGCCYLAEKTGRGNDRTIGRLPACFDKGIPFFEIPGKHSLLFYLLHQPVILLVLAWAL